MTDAASLNFSIDSSGADRAKQSLDQMTQSSKAAAEAAALLIKAQQAQIDQLQQMILMQGQVSQGHSSLSSTIMPLAGALAIGAGSFAAVNYAMNSFTDLIQNKVSSALDSLNQRLYTSFSLMGSLGLSNGNIGNTFMGMSLNQQVTGVNPLFNLQSQYSGVVSGIGAQGGANVGAAFNNPYNLQMQSMMNGYGINPMNSSPQNQQALIQAMLNTRPSASRTADFAALGLGPDQIQAAYVQQQMMNARTPSEVWNDNLQQTNSQALLASGSNQSNWNIIATQRYAAARAMPSATDNAALTWDKRMNNGSWYSRLFDTGQAEDTRRQVAYNDAAGYAQNLESRGAIATQDLWNHFTGAGATRQGWGTDFTQSVVGLTAPVAEAANKFAVNFGLPMSSQWYTQAPKSQQSFSDSELNSAAASFAKALDGITPAADQISGIRNGWQTLNDLLGSGSNGQSGSLTSLLQGYTNSSGVFQPGAKQALQGLPNGDQTFSIISDILNGRLNDSKNQLTNPFTYANTVANQAQMSVSMASSGASGGQLQAQYSALQRMGLDPTAANIAKYQNDAAFQSNMQNFNQSPFMQVGLQNQASNLTQAQLQVLSTLPANDRAMYAGDVNTLTAPGTLGNIAVTQGQTNSAPADVLAYIKQQATLQGASPAVIAQLQAMAGVEGGGYDNVSQNNNGTQGIGPGQLTNTPSFLKSIGVKDINNWEDNAKGMVTYYMQLLKKNNGNLDAATYAYNGSGPSALNYVGKVDSMAGLSAIPGAAGVIGATNSAALLSAQTNQTLSAGVNQGLYAGGADLGAGGPGSGFNAQMAIAYAQAMQGATVTQPIAMATAKAQIDAQSAYRFGALRGQTSNLQAQSDLLRGAYGATGLSPSQYNQNIMTAEGLSAAVPINSYFDKYSPYQAANNAQAIQNAQIQTNNQGLQQLGQTTNQGFVLQAQAQAGPAPASQESAAYIATVGNSSLDPTIKAQLISGYLKNQQQGQTNTAQNQAGMAAFNNSALAQQAAINPFLSPTQQAMQLGQIQITQAQNVAYGLVNPDGSTKPMNTLQQSQTAALIGQNNQTVGAQQAVQAQQQVSQDIQGMSETVVASLEKLATGGYNAGYILKSAASNIAGLGAQALVFQPLQNAISGAIGNIPAAFGVGSSSAITNGGIFGSLLNSAFSLGGSANSGAGGHTGASVSSGGTSFLSSALGAIGGLFTSGAASGLIPGGDFGYAGAGGSFSAASLIAHQGGSLARGGVLSGGEVMPFADGGIFDQPTNFPMAGGTTGLMGEAGPEAVVPLTRGPDGKLGIASPGGGQQSQSGASVTIHAPISVSTGSGGKMTAAQQADMQAQFQQMLYSSVKQVITNEQRNGGTLQRY